MPQDEINCPICNSGNYRLIFESRDFRFRTSEDKFNVVRCNKCNFIFLNPRPGEDIINSFYPADFNERTDSFFYKVIEPSFKIAQRLTINLIKKYMPKGKILDIGCGNGDFLLAMQKNGYDVYGVEPNRDAKKFCPERLSGRIFYCGLKECDFSPKTFDVITMFQSLEHIWGLNETLDEINRIIKNNGILYICVPDVDFFESCIFGPYYYNLEVPRHFYFFSKKSIRQLLSGHGFRVERFIKNSLFEFVSTPTSFYRSLLYFFQERNISINGITRSIIFVPLVLVRLMIRILFAFQDQNLKLIAFKNESI